MLLEDVPWCSNSQQPLKALHTASLTTGMLTLEDRIGKGGESIPNNKVVSTHVFVKLLKTGLGFCFIRKTNYEQYSSIGTELYICYTSRPRENPPKCVI